MRILWLLVVCGLLAVAGCASVDETKAVKFEGCFVKCSACAGLEVGCIDAADSLHMNIKEEAGEPGAGVEILGK